MSTFVSTNTWLGLYVLTCLFYIRKCSAAARKRQSSGCLHPLHLFSQQYDLQAGEPWRQVAPALHPGCNQDGSASRIFMHRAACLCNFAPRPCPAGKCERFFPKSRSRSGKKRSLFRLRRHFLKVHNYAVSLAGCKGCRHPPFTCVCCGAEC